MQAQGRAPSALALAVCMAAEPVLLSVFSKMLRGPRVHLKPGPRSPAGAFTTAVCVRDGKHPFLGRFSRHRENTGLQRGGGLLGYEDNSVISC